MRTEYNLLNELAKHSVDAIDWKTKQLLDEAGKHTGKLDGALTEFCKLLAMVRSSYQRELYAKRWSRPFGTKEKTILDRTAAFSNLDEVDEEEVENARFALPKGVDAKEYLRNGFYALEDGYKTGYYFNLGKGNEQVKVSNFVIKPLFHIESPNPEDNKRMIEINNGFLTKVLDFQSGVIVSSEKFKQEVIGRGNFVFHGNSAVLLRLAEALGDRFPICRELKTLGWQPEGFFAYSDHIYNGKMQKIDELGMVSHDEQFYYSPSAGIINKNVRADDDEYENDRFIRYTQAPINFEGWAELMYDAYGDHGMMAIAWVMLTILKDFVYSVDSNCPLLYAFGEKRSGKSKWGESISNLFFLKMNAYNLNSGTDFSFFSRMRRYVNCPTLFNEFDDKFIRPEWFQALKGSYDGEGRERGKGGSKNRTEVMKINSSIIMLGQYLTTRDDNALLSRCIICAFRPVENRGDKVMAAYDRLKQLEDEGLNSILEDVLQVRIAHLSKHKYYKLFQESFEEIQEAVKAIPNQKWEDRPGRNYTAVFACMKIVMKHFKMPFGIEDFKAYVVDGIVDVTRMLTQSDTLSEFWNIIMACVETGKVTRGFDYKIEARATIDINETSGKVVREFGEPKKLLLLRFNNVHQKYKEVYKQQTGKEAMNAESIKNYFKNRDYFFGMSDGHRFSGEDSMGKKLSISSPTSCYVFDYEMLERLGVMLDISVLAKGTPDVKPPDEAPVPSANSFTESKVTEEGDLPF